MKPVDSKMRTYFTIKNVRNATKRIKIILDTDYKKANFKKIFHNLIYLNNDKQSLFLKLLRKHEEILDDILGNFTGSEYKIELLQVAKPYHAKPLPLPKIH